MLGEHEFKLESWWSSGLTPKQSWPYFIFQDYDGESLKITRRTNSKAQQYFALDYQGQGPVVMEIDEAKRFIKKWQKLIDEIEQPKDEPK